MYVHMYIQICMRVCVYVHAHIYTNTCVYERDLPSKILKFDFSILPAFAISLCKI